MTIRLAIPGEVIDAWPSIIDVEDQAVVLRTPSMEVVRLYLAAGARVPTHEAQGEVTILCIQGRFTVHAIGASHTLHTGQLLYLLVHEPFELYGDEASSVLLTILAPKSGTPVELIGTAAAPPPPSGPTSPGGL